MDIKELREKSFDFVRTNGPILPVQISKFLGSDIIVASAVLSDLISQKKVFVTSIKYGGSPFYYVNGQEHKLPGLSEHFKGKHKEIYEILHKRKVLRDKFLEPWQRVAVREIKDFAKMLRVVYGDNEEIFWKWYNLPDDESKGIIKGFFVEKEVVKKETVEKEEVPEKIVKEEEPEEKIEGIQTKLKESSEEKLPVKEKVVKPSGEFYDGIISYFRSKNIKVVDEKVVKKGKEFDFVAEVPSSVGSLRFYIKAKDKKKINEGDLSLARGESKDMSVIFVSKGELTKKAKEMVEEKFNGSLLFKRVS